MNNGKIRAMARERLKGNWQVLILCLLLFILLGGCCNFIAKAICAPWCESLFSSIFMLFIDALIVMGFVGMILKIARKKKVIFEELFDGVDLFEKYIGVTLILWLVTFIMGLIEFLAFKSLIVVITYQANINEILAVILIIFGLLLTVAIIMVEVYLCISLSQTYFILYDEPDSKVFAVIGKSFDLMDNYILEYFMLALSFIGWIILGIFTLGILYLWLIPYMLVSFAIFYDKIKKDYDATSGDEKALAETAVEVQAISEKPVKKTSTKTAAKKTSKPAAKKTTTTKKTTATKTAAKKTSTKASPRKTTTRKTTARKTTK